MRGPSPIDTKPGLDADARQRGKAHPKAIAEAVLAADILDDPRWRELAVVFSVSDSGRNFGNSGYAYGGDGAWWAVSFPVPLVKEPILSLLADLHDPIPSDLVRVLFQYNRETKQTKVLSEFDNLDRWSIAPDTAHKVMGEIKPNLASIKISARNSGVVRNIRHNGGKA